MPMENKVEDRTRDASVIITSQQKDKEGKYIGFLAAPLVEIMRSLTVYFSIHRTAFGLVKEMLTYWCSVCCDVYR